MSDNYQKQANIALVAIGVIALFAALEVGQAVFAPVVLGLVMGIVMSPLSDRFDSLGLPRAAGAIGALLLILFLLGGLLFFLEPVIENAVDSFPRLMLEVNRLMFEVKDGLRGLEQASEEVSKALSGDETAEEGLVVVAEQPQEGEGGEQAAVPSVEDAIFMAPAILSQVLIFVGTLFFFILTKRDIYGWVARRIVRTEAQDDTRHRLRMAERQVARYFLTISIINFGYGVVVSLVMLVIGMPSPFLWGVAAGLLNFVLYLGPLVMLAALLAGGIVVFEGAYSVVPMISYLFINLLEAQFVTPSLVGKRLEVNPLLIFLSLIFFLWLWGPIGGIIAIPLLLWVLTVAADIRDLRQRYADTDQEAAEPSEA